MSFTRELRYIVLKLTDIRAAGLMDDEIDALENILDMVNRARAARGRKSLECVVVESDWPEYEPTWQAIEQRFTEEAQKVGE